MHDDLTTESNEPEPADELDEIIAQLSTAVEPPLTALQADLFQVTGNALAAAASALEMSPEERMTFKGLSHTGRSRFLARMYQESAAAKATIERHLFASRVTVQRFESITGVLPGFERMCVLLTRGSGVNVRDGLNTISVGAHRDLRPTFVSALDNDRTAITYTLFEHKRAVLGPDMRPIAPVRRLTFRLLVDPRIGRLEIRGQAGRLGEVRRQLERHLVDGGQTIAFQPLSLADVDVVDLGSRTNCRLVKVKFRRDDSDVSGIASTEHTAALDEDGSGDLASGEGFSARPEGQTATRWSAVFPYDGQNYSVVLNTVEGTVFFRNGTTSEPVINYFMDGVHASTPVKL